jgi:S-adenosylmethionine:tRNA ribosyltransferase-isomerase
MRVDDLDYQLPDELIATKPTDRRDEARLLVSRGPGHPTEHRHIRDLPDILQPGDLLIFNDTKVLPARFFAERAATGGKVEGLYLETRDDRVWHVMLKSGGRPAAGESLTLGDDHALRLIEQLPDGSWLIEKQSDLDTEQLLDRVGVMPLPPYIEKQRGEGNFADFDRKRYQTVYAKQAGAVAAPTAGLHFTDELLGQLRQRGVATAYLTLHVGLGTFAPVRSETLDDHPMHTEHFIVPGPTIDAISRAKRDGRRIIAIGTTSVRAIESLPDPLPTPAERDYRSATDLLIQPGYAFRYTDAMLTNFHLPRSTLIALVAAKVGLDRIKSLYAEAIEHRYRFYSYGDAMLLLD